MWVSQRNTSLPRRILQRTFTSSRCRFNAHAGPVTRAEDNDKTVDQAGGKSDSTVMLKHGSLSRNATSHSHRKAFLKWSQNAGAQYQMPQPRPGTNYLEGKPHPFPLNPYFQPRPPVSSTTKQNLFSDWNSGSGLRQLAQKYGLSLERIEAILRLQQVEERLTEEGKLQMASYAEVMSSMLGVDAAETQDTFEDEQPVEITMDPGRQLFTLIPESSNYNPIDAAQELGKIPFATKKDLKIQAFVRHSNYEHESAFQKLRQRTTSPGQEVIPNSVCCSRWSFSILDIPSRQRMVREPNGSLLKKEEISRASTHSMKWSR